MSPLVSTVKMSFVVGVIAFAGERPTVPRCICRSERPRLAAASEIVISPRGDPVHHTEKSTRETRISVGADRSTIHSFRNEWFRWSRAFPPAH
ncbi:MAG TPA: hypothetical protein VK698_30800 [Kofleriaceae bacterium]|nr:hypothetical protein [Kofleriaceae bacterium]